MAAICENQHCVAWCMEEESRKCIFFEMQLIRNRVSLRMKESLIKIANFDFSSRTICTMCQPALY